MVKLFSVLRKRLVASLGLLAVGGGFPCAIEAHSRVPTTVPGALTQASGSLWDLGDQAGALSAPSRVLGWPAGATFVSPCCSQP